MFLITFIKSKFKIQEKVATPNQEGYVKIHILFII
jgi:hypothetical protein